MKVTRMYWLLAGACLLAFGAGMGYPFLRCQDDWAYVTANEHLLAGWSHILQLASTPVLELATPLPQVSYLIDYSIGGLDPMVYHVINLLWHIGMVLLVFRLFRELGIRKQMAFWAALLFAIHPQRVESVIWISERKDVMCGFFFVLTCLCFLIWRRKHRPGGPVFYWGSLAAMAAAMASKPSAAALPLVLMALDFHRTRKLRFKPVLGHFVLLAGYLIIARTLLANAGNHFSEGGFRLLLGIRNYCMYFLKTFYPAEICPLYPYIELGWKDFALIAISLAALLWLWIQHRQKALYDALPMLFCAGIVLAPVSGIMIFSNADFADRYSYIPAVFFLGMAALLLPPLPEKVRKWAFCYPAAILLCTWIYLPNWNGEEAFLQEACSKPGSNFRGAAIYAALLAEQNNAKAGLEVLQSCDRTNLRAVKHREYLELQQRMLQLMVRYQAGEDPVRLYPEFTAILDPAKNRRKLQALAYTSLLTFLSAHADCALASGKPAEAATIYETLAQAYHQEEFTSSFYMGVARMIRRDPAGAVVFFERAAAASPDDEQTKRNLQNARRLAAEKQH